MLIIILSSHFLGTSANPNLLGHLFKLRHQLSHPARHMFWGVELWKKPPSEVVDAVSDENWKLRLKRVFGYCRDYKAHRIRALALRAKSRLDRTRYRLLNRDWSMPQLLIGRIHHLGTWTRANVVASGCVLVFLTWMHFDMCFVSFLLGLGLGLRQQLNGPSIKIITVALLFLEHYFDNCCFPFWFAPSQRCIVEFLARKYLL